MPPGFTIRHATEADRWEIAELIYISINHWYQIHGRGQLFQGGPHVADVFFEAYESLDPGCCIVAECNNSKRIMGSCFYHPRPLHVSLGIMAVHPNHWGSGTGKKLLDWIIDFSQQEDKPLRLTQSAINLDSFSLYNKAGFVPRQAYQDMFIEVPENGLDVTSDGDACVRDGRLEDVQQLAALEKRVSGITREQDYEFMIANELGYWGFSVYECSDNGELLGFLGSCAHPGCTMIGPGVSDNESVAESLLFHRLNAFAGKMAVFLIPVDAENLVQRLYSIGARNCELHFAQVLGDCQPYDGINMPTFMPETG
jgi:GNAT superfamily N-acetyltransferase